MLDSLHGFLEFPAVLVDGFFQSPYPEQFDGSVQVPLEVLGFPPRRRDCGHAAITSSISGAGMWMRSISDGSNLTSPPA